MTEPALLMPFVCVSSVGGPYDDNSFVAGYQCSQIDAALDKKPGSYWVMAYSTLRDQLDLVAMKNGYAVQFQETEVDEWTYAKFRRVN